MRPLAIVTDIEGTTSSIGFVKDVLFPYAARNLPGFIRSNLDNRDVMRQLRSMSAYTGIALGDTDELILQLLQWIRDDKKITELKALQGMVWEKGYQQGEYQAHVYPDVPPKLREWFDQGINLYVYSSGSEKAQRLFFRYSDVGDLRLLFAGYFDTTFGPKQDKASYQNIAEAIALKPQEILFLSDIEAELDAAQEAGFRTTWLVRPKDSPLDPYKLKSKHPIARDFNEIDID
jgi:enolase-phosphatase E1